MSQDASQPGTRLIFGVVSLGVGFVAANLALFNWIERTGLSYLLANYARYVCAYGGFGAMIFGAMLVNEFFIKKELLKKSITKALVPTTRVKVRRKTVTQSAVDKRPRKKVIKTVRRAQQTA